MKKLLWLLAMLAWRCGLQAMEGLLPQQREIEAEQVTAKEELKTESPTMLILVDSLKAEITLPSTYLTASLFWALSLSKFPVLVTKSILYNLLMLKEGGAEQFFLKQDLSLKIFDGKSGWRIYDVDNGLFFLLVPSEFLVQHKNNNGLNIDGNGKSFLSTLKNITEVLKKKNRLDVLKGMSEAQGDFKIEDLKNVFQKAIVPGEKITWLKALESQKTWNIILSGHGSLHEKIADLDRSNLKDFLSFLNAYIRTELLYVMSCYAGGANRIYFKEIAGKQLGSSLNYLVIIQGVTNQPTFRVEVNLFDLFLDAVQSIDKGTGLNKFLKAMNAGYENIPIIHKTPHIPQVLLPGGLEFQTFNIDDKVLSMGYLFAEKHRLENKPIKVQSKDAVLIYPSAVYPVLKVETQKSGQWTSSALSNLGLLQEMKSNYEDQIKAHSENFPAYIAYEKLPFMKLAENYIYPEFIPMDPLDKRCWFKRIDLYDKATENGEGFRGVMQFIRDSFAVAMRTSTTETFYIDELEGLNDLSLAMEHFRLFSKKYDENSSVKQEPIELLLANAIGKRITLEKVVITKKGSSDRGSDISITFILTHEDVKKAWKIMMRVNDGTPYWSLEWEEDLEDYERFMYDSKIKFLKKGVPSTEIEQKTVPEILEQKQKRGPLKIKEELKIETPFESKSSPEFEAKQPPEEPKVSQLLKGNHRHQKWARRVSSKHSYQTNRSFLLNVRCQNSRSSYWFKKSSRASARAFDEKIV